MQYIILILILILLSPTLAILIGSLSQNIEFHIISYIFSKQAQVETLIYDTLSLSTGSASIAFLFGAPLGFLIFRSNIYHKRLFLWFVLLGAAIPLHIHTSNWIALLGREGILSPYIKILLPNFNLYSVAGSILIMGIAYIPLVALLCGYSFLRVDRSLEEETYTQYPSRKVFFYITLPQSCFNLFLVWLFIFLIALGEMSVTDFLGVQTTFAEKIYLLYSIYFQPHLALYLAVPLLAFISLILIGIAAKISKQNLFIVPVLPKYSYFPPQIVKKLSIVIISLLIIFYLPTHLLSLPLIYSGFIVFLFALVWIYKQRKIINQQQINHKSYYDFSDRWRWLPSFIAFFTTLLVWLPVPTLILTTGKLSKLINTYKAVAPEFWGTFSIAMVAGSIGSLLAVFLAWNIIRNTPYKIALIVVLTWLMILPPPLLGIGIVRLWDYFPYLVLINKPLFMLQESRYMVSLGLILRFLPFAVAIALFALRTIPKEIEEQAILEGYSPLDTLFRVSLPLSVAPLCLSFAVIFIFSLGELGTSVLIVPPGPTTLSIRIFTLMHYGVRGDVSSCALLLLLVLMSLIVVCEIVAIILQKRQV